MPPPIQERKDPTQKTQIEDLLKEFKLEAVQLVQTSKKPLAQIALDLGIADSTRRIIGGSCSPSKAHQAFPGSGHQNPTGRGNSPLQARK